MILSDKDILKLQEKDPLIDPFTLGNLQPASYDLTLSNRAYKYKSRYLGHIDIDEPPAPHLIGEGFIFDQLKMFPGDFLLCSTRECVSIPPDLVGRVEGRSSLGRCGLMVHITAGFIDPGFVGHLTLELYHVGNIPLLLYPKTRIAQIIFEMLSSVPDKVYGAKELHSKYQNQGINPDPILREIKID